MKPKVIFSLPKQTGCMAFLRSCLKYTVLYIVMLFLVVPPVFAQHDPTLPDSKRVKSIPKWKLEKMALDFEAKVGETFIGKYRRGNSDEWIEFYFNSKQRLKGRYVGTNRFDYQFSITDIKIIDERTIEYKVKGKVYRATRIDESLQVVYPGGAIQYCPKLSDAALTSK